MVGSTVSEKLVSYTIYLFSNFDRYFIKGEHVQWDNCDYRVDHSQPTS
jgi:hypothetical protein